MSDIFYIISESVPFIPDLYRHDLCCNKIRNNTVPKTIASVRRITQTIGIKLRREIKYGDIMEVLDRKVNRPIMRKEMHTRLPVITNRDLLKLNLFIKRLKGRRHLPIVFMKDIKGRQRTPNLSY